MYNQSSNVFMNGGHGPQQRFGMPMGSSKNFQPGQHHQSHHPRQQDHSGFSNHQHNASGGAFSTGAPVFNSGHMRNGTPNQMQNNNTRTATEHWQHQLALADQARGQSGTHPHARNHHGQKLNANGAPESRRDEREEHSRTQQSADHGTHSWAELDLGGQGLRSLSPGLFTFPFLKKLYLSHNKLTRLHPAIGKLRNLTHLDLSINNLRFLPGEVGMLVNLRSLLVFDNNLEELPYELGYLFRLEMLGIEGNHNLDPELRAVVEEHGTRALIGSLQDSAETPEPPNDRDWIILDESKAVTTASPSDKLSVLSYNTLCDRAATTSQYGYTSPEHLAWDHRKELILYECRDRDPDILCLQEVEQDAWNEYFRPELARNGYKSAFWAKARARTMALSEAKSVDGCATFFKNNKWILLDKQTIDFANVAINRPDMKTEADIFNRVMPRDHVALCTFLENRWTGARLLVVNTHVEWNPIYADVKLVQTAILMEQVARLAETWSKLPACRDKKLYRYSEMDDDSQTNGADASQPPPEPAPSQEYSSGAQVPVMICGDFNSTDDSGVYSLIADGTLPRDHEDLGDFHYGNFTRDGMSHPFSLKSAYDKKQMPFTNYTPGFRGMIDYIWYSTNAMQVTGLLGEVDKKYLERVPGFPNVHFPSDHLALMAEFVFKQRKGQSAISSGPVGASGR